MPYDTTFEEQIFENLQFPSDIELITDEELEQIYFWVFGGGDDE